MTNAAILVGCGTYVDKQISSLDFAQLDAAALRHMLVDKCGVDEDAYLLARSVDDSNGLPTRSEIIRVLTLGPTIARRAKIDTLFFAFSGHGFRSDERNVDYLLPEDAVAGALEDTGLDYDFVVRALRRWGAERIVILLDACRATREAGKGSDSGTDEIRIEGLQRDGVATFSSCAPGERSYEAPELSQGIFTAALLRALSDEGRCATIYELNAFLIREVPKLSERCGRPRQHPYTRVEPLALQGCRITSEATFRKWSLDKAIGSEIGRQQLHLEGGSAIIGIDFGTTSSAACVVSKDSGELSILKVDSASVLLPSTIHFVESLDYTVGTEAVRRAERDADHAIQYVKRDLGTGVPRDIYGRSIFPEVAASLIIGSLKKVAESELRTRAGEVIAAYPANFSNAQISALGDAFLKAGFDRVRFFSEPTIAAVAADKFAEGTTFSSMLVIDLGGGTLDVSLVEAGDGVFEVKAVGGDRSLGGLDYDKALAKLLIDRASSLYPNLRIPPNLAALEAERAKILLGRQETAIVYLGSLPDLLGEPVEVVIPVSRAEASQVFGPLDARVLASVDDVLSRADLDGDPMAIVLAGQGTKLFTLDKAIRRKMPAVPVVTNLQETAVVRGLGSYLRVLTGFQKERLLLEALSLSYGLLCGSVTRRTVQTAWGRRASTISASLRARRTMSRPSWRSP